MNMKIEMESAARRTAAKARRSGAAGMLLRAGLACALAAAAFPAAAGMLTVDLRDLDAAFSEEGGRYAAGGSFYALSAATGIYLFVSTSTADAGEGYVVPEAWGTLILTNASEECGADCNGDDDTALDGSASEGLGVTNEVHDGSGSLRGSIANFGGKREIVQFEFVGSANDPGFTLTAIELWTATTEAQAFRIEAFDAGGVMTGFVDGTTDQNTIDEGGGVGGGTPTNFAAYAVGLRGARFHIIGTQLDGGPDSGFRIASLSFTQVPLPPAFWDLGAACLGFGVCARRRRTGGAQNRFVARGAPARRTRGALIHYRTKGAPTQSPARAR